MTPPLTLRVPGDKSISHRALLLAAFADGESRLRGLPDAADVRSTAACLRRLGAEISRDRSGEVRVPGPARFRDAEGVLDCGNSGTTARLLAGVVTGAGVEARMDGDGSLRSRPMERVVYPLQAMGGRIEYEGEEGRLPLRFRPRATGSLRVMRHIPKVASAQVKSCMLLAGLAAGVRVEVLEPGISRDHTERMLEALGAPVERGPVGEEAPLEEGRRVVFDPGEGDVRLRPLDLTVPGDLSSAAFLVAAALLTGRPLRLEGVGLNPTRTGFLEVLRRAGAAVTAREVETRLGEPVGTIEVSPSELRPFEVVPDEVPNLQDEIPALAVLAARTPGWSEFRGAGELRVKESDRLALVADNLQRLGVRCEERTDGLRIHGSAGDLEGRVTTGGDHRIAMAFGVLGAAAGDVEVDRPRCVEVSYPRFWRDLERVTGGARE